MGKKQPKKGTGDSFKIGGSTFINGLGPTKKQAGRKSEKGTDIGMEWDGMGDGLGEAGDTDEEMMKAAIQASFVTAAQEISASLMTAGAGPSTSCGIRTSMSIPPKKGQSLSPTKRGVRKSKAIVSDSDSDFPFASESSNNKSKKKGNSVADVIELGSSDSDYNGSPMDVDTVDLSSDGKGAVESGLDDEEEELQPAKTRWQRRAPLTAEEIAAKAELRTLENKERKKLGRPLTFVRLCPLLALSWWTTLTLFPFRPRGLQLPSIAITQSLKLHGVIWKSARSSNQ
jgi:gas vesicle protein